MSDPAPLDAPVLRAAIGAWPDLVVLMIVALLVAAAVRLLARLEERIAPRRRGE